MKSLLFKFGLGVVGICGALFGLAFFMVAEERDPPLVLPGYHSLTIGAAHRDAPLPAHIWYPAQQQGSPGLLGQNALFYGHYALQNAAPLDQAAPVVVLSHGSGGNAVQLGWLAGALAQQGMIVIATDHPGTRSRDSDPHQTVKVWQRPADMAALLDTLASDPPIGLQPDLSRVAALGFSLGGHSALSLAGLRVSKDRFIDYCDRNAGKVDCGWMQDAGVDFTAIDAALYEQSNRDPRVTAVVAIDPALPQAVAEDGTADLTADTLILNLGAVETVPEAMRADALAARMPQAAFEAIEGAAHFSFLAECSMLGKVIIGLASPDKICSDRGLRPRGAVHADVLDRVSRFLSAQFGL